MTDQNLIKPVYPFDAEIVEIEAEQAYQFLNRIPEFSEPFIPLWEFKNRLSGKNCLILGAKYENEIIGCKVGYGISDSEFYTWMGAVLPEFRNKNIAGKLAEYQEKWAKKKGYEAIRLKTRNKHQNMLLFAIKNGFEIIDFEPKSEILENRIILKKSLV